MRTIEGYETERLRIRRLRLGDWREFYALNREPEMQRYERPPRLTLWAQWEMFYFSVSLRYRSLGPFFHRGYMLRSKETDEAIGFASIYSLKSNECHIGYSIARAHWRQGYATEAAQALIRFSFDSLKKQKIVAGCYAGNKASVRLLRKLGFRLREHASKIPEENWEEFTELWFCLDRQEHKREDANVVQALGGEK